MRFFVSVVLLFRPFQLIWVRYFGFWVGISSRLRQFTIHDYSWNNSRRCRSTRKKRDGYHWSLHWSAPWGSFRTPRRERLMADIVIISMLYESIGLVSVNDVFFVYQLIYMENESFANLLKSFVIQRSISLMIVWFFHQCISCDRNSLSEHGCHGRLVEKMKNTSTCSNC